MSENYEHVDLFCDDTSEAASYGLAALMAGISEEYYCAGWMISNEYALWQARAGTGYGQGVITERQARLLADLSAECDGWFRWSGENGLTFVRLKEWEKHLAERSHPSSPVDGK